MFTLFLAMLNEEQSPETQKNIKVAFAEGYLAADPKKAKSRVGNMAKKIRNVIDFFVLITILMLLWSKFFTHLL